MLNVINILEKLIKFNTQSENTNLPLIYFIKTILEKSGFQIKIFKYGAKANLIAKIGKGSGGLILSGHTDTVPAGPGWETNPLQLIKKQNRFYGLGVVDMKGAIATMIIAACKISREITKTKKFLYLVFTFDEEKNFKGIKKLLDTQIIKTLDLAIIGEPTDMGPVIAHKGVTTLEIKILGKEAHSSNPKQGVNAIEMAGELICNLQQLAFKIQQTKDLRFNPAYSTLNIGKIKGGLTTNKVPAFCSLALEYRAISKDEDKYLFKQVQQLVNGEVQKKISVSPFESSVNKNIISIIEAITKQKSKAVSYATEAVFYEKRKIPTIILGPGNIKQAHRANEYIIEEELKQAVKIYSQIIEQICLCQNADIK